VALLRIREVEALDACRLRLSLSDGSVVERDVSALLRGPAFAEIRERDDRFRDVRAEAGTVVWANGADLCPDVLISEPRTCRDT
jgi:hypothetical protein